MLCFIDTVTDPYWNLAAEEYLLYNMKEPVFRLWRNSPAVICGKYQNARAEINSEFIRKNNIPVVRRLTGGGAVFHDLGNINFTFIEKKREGEDTSDMFRRFTMPIIEALQALGVDASLQGRNDLVIDGKRFSGNAICTHKNRVLQHGTLLFSASMGNLSGALNTRPEKFIGKSVKSNVARVTNISEHLPESKRMDVLEFMNYLKEFITSRTDEEEYIIRDYTQEEYQAITELRNSKYATDEWNFGNSPEYTFNNTFRLPCGFFEIFLSIGQGTIKECRIMGDYFFLKPTEHICEALTGIPHTHEAIMKALSPFDLKEYFGADISEELASNMM